ncbi:MAG: iron ABC transporter permease [Gammaproteobacteria bacterium]|nr:iron ABC transporter permease [Gammaproteobacteria bacterium]NIR84618.1 iron ABC transporter permease [Gammaproteobacteria bacterium]NIR90521.1 iron ABC transporter permease [Gammaproteobacteria bacterium]NIU05669.1 iron ABC transporter permease [Gammaproteobacteria bacterium]NIV52808.1 ABC transporter permease subunit [Gammaproteobacteria bacterium]
MKVFAEQPNRSELSRTAEERLRLPRPGRPSAWSAGVLLVALLVAFPVLTVFAYVFHPAGEVWRHLAETVLADYVTNSLLLMLGVAAGTLLIGTSTAWLTTMCRFPGRRFFGWALLLPLAFPAYIIAYTYTGMLDVAGPAQTHLREWFGWQVGEYWFPPVRSLGGAMVMLSLVLYPYVYLLARAGFLEQSSYAVDVSRTLGCGAWASFFRVSLPAARPAIIAGLSLALMETLADYGTVQYFGVSTFTTGIFRTWFGLGNSAAAAQLAALLMLFVFALILAERRSRRKARYSHVGSRSRPLPSYPLRGVRSALAAAACAVPLFLGFLLPCGQLVVWAFATAQRMVDAHFFTLVANTLSLAGSTALLAALLALFLGYGRRLQRSAPVALAVRVASMGYAVPGMVIAVGVMLPFAWIDNAVDAWMRAHVGVSTGLILSGTLFALVFAYLVRFLAVSLHTVEAGLGKITPSMDEAARSLGYRSYEVVRRVHLPIIRGSLLTAVLLVFVDVMKELPATLILRPFNFNTLAVRAYELASDERLADSSTAALAIVAAGIVPVILLSISIARSRRREVSPPLTGVLTAGA